LYQIERLKNAGYLRPVNNVKTYGSATRSHGGGTHDAVEKVVRSTLFGSAAVRFHRPTAGIGLNDTAQAVISSLRMATNQMDFFHAKPHNDLLEGRSENEAFCRAIPGAEYLVYFPDAGEVELRLPSGERNCRVGRVDLLTGKWSEEEIEVTHQKMVLQSDTKHILFLVQHKSP
jgi:hypothetical protein